MTIEEIKNLPVGVYRVYWKTDPTNYSVAAYGVLNDGTRWLAPANWTSKTPAGVIITNDLDYEKFDDIERMELIEQPPYAYVKQYHYLVVVSFLTKMGGNGWGNVEVKLDKDFWNLEDIRNVEKGLLEKNAEWRNAVIVNVIKLKDGKLPERTHDNS